MSNTEKDAGSNDVLSSFLKLVSDSDRENMPAPQKDRSYRIPTRLLLTEALRVTPQETEAADEPEKPASDDNKVFVLDSAQRADRVGLEATIAELEAAVTSQSDEWEDEEDETFDEQTWAESAFRILEEVPSLAPMDEDTENDESDAPIVDDVSVKEAEADVEPPAPEQEKAVVATLDNIDDTALRAIIAEVVREELGGEVGMRITRNIRKMVRREMTRMMATRDLD